MMKYKIDVIAELKKKGFTSMTARTTGTFSQSTMTKFSKGDTTISLDNLNRLCAILDMQPEEIITYEKSDTEDRYLAYMNKFHEK